MEFSLTHFCVIVNCYHNHIHSNSNINMSKVREYVKYTIFLVGMCWMLLYLSTSKLDYMLIVFSLNLLFSIVTI